MFANDATGSAREKLMRVSIWLFVCCVPLLLSGCKGKPANVPVQEKTQPSLAVAAPAIAPALTAILAPEQIGSTLRVRVVYGGLPPADTIGALLHRDEISGKMPTEGKVRYVLTLLKGWTEVQLHSTTARFFVTRNKTIENGDLMATTMQASLMGFDEKTGVALLAYSDDFDYSLDVGFHLQQKYPAHSDILLIRTSKGPGYSVYHRTIDGGSVTLELPYTVDSGLYQGSHDGAKASLPSPPDGKVADDTFLAVYASGRLAGFASVTPEGKAVVTPAGPFSTALKVPMVKITQVSLAYDGESLEMRLSAEMEGGGTLPEHAWLRKAPLEQSPDIDEKASPDPIGSYAPIPGDRLQLWGSNQGLESGTMEVIIPMPAENGEDTYRLQVEWPLIPASGLPANGVPTVFGKPFVLRVARNASGFFPTVAGLTSDESAPAASEPDDTAEAAGPQKFTLEAAARNVHMVAGGRGALIQLVGAPYWKLFSFEKNDWLQLPGSLENASITGNLDSIFIMDRDAKTVRKLKLPELTSAGTLSLPPGDYYAILAGCNTSRAPVSIVTGSTTLAFDPANLEQGVSAAPGGEGMSARPSDDLYGFSISGDGQTLQHLTDANSMLGITAGFSIANRLKCTDTAGGRDLVFEGPTDFAWASSPAVLSENAPVLFRFQRVRGHEIPPKPPRLGCFSFFSTSAFAKVDVPEMAVVKDNDISTILQRWVFLDPYSKQLATLSADRKTWCVRKLTIAENESQPAILNWPDTSVPRDGLFTFQPVTAGVKNITAEVLGKPGLATVDATEKVEFRVPRDDISALSLVTLKIQGKEGVEVSCPILLHTVSATPFAVNPFAVPASTNLEGLNSRGTGVQSLGASTKDLYPLEATCENFKDSVDAIPGAVNDCAILVTDANRVDFLSLKSGGIAGSVATPPGALYYPGAGALFEFDPAKRTLARISVPKGEREQVLDIPSNVDLNGIGLGTAPESRITLAVTVRPGGTPSRFSDLKISGTAPHTAYVVLDSHTFKAGLQPQPVYLTDFLGKHEKAENPFAGVIGAGKNPSILPASHDGAMVNLPRQFIATGPAYAVAYPCERSMPGLNLSSTEFGRGGGSISGLMAFSDNGEAYKGEIKVGNDSDQFEYGSTPCGRYVMRQARSIDRDSRYLEIDQAETGRPLLRVARLPFMDGIPFTPESARYVVMLGDEGPLAILDASKKRLELVKLNIPEVAKAISPSEFHVVSQPVPWVMEGHSMQYQVKVNNPDAVQTFQLQKEVPGMNITPSGLFSCEAPAVISGPVRIMVSIGIKGKDGRVVLHEFPLYVLPLPRQNSLKFDEI